MMDTRPEGFTQAIRTLNVDARGRVNIGSVLPDSRGCAYHASIDPLGRILLTPTEDSIQTRVAEHG